MTGRRLRTAARVAVAGALLLPAGVLLPGSAAQAAGYHVLMSGFAFSPQALTVPDGATVTWTNEDTAPHDVTTSSGPVAVHGSMLTKGQSWTYTFTTPGTYVYYCSFHPYMRAELIVEPPPTAAAATTARAVAPAATPAARPTSAPSLAPRNSPSPASAAAPAPSTSPDTPTPAPVTTATSASAAQPLSPLLLLAGLVTAVAVLCLLLVGSRASWEGSQ
jgi:amicyanin